ncbi:MAG: glutamate racemase [Eubacterium sp.]|nr:glutamate racemase [Eubacterium sp.]
MDNRRIGFFDSGIGGLTSIPYLMRDFPDEHVIFFGDTARTPYGSKSGRVIRRFTLEIGDFMERSGVKMMVAACNTISATSLDVLREKYPDIPVTGVIEPVCDVVAAKCGSDDHVGIIATRATVSTGAYVNAIKARRPDMENIFQTACPAFVPLIEEGIIDNNIMHDTVRYYLDDFVRENRIDTLVLGCTHYQLIRKVIEEIYPDIRTISSSEEVVKEIGAILKSRDMLAGENDEENVFYASDLSENFINMINMLLGNEQDDLNIRFKNLDM